MNQTITITGEVKYIWNNDTGPRKTIVIMTQYINPITGQVIETNHTVNLWNGWGDNFTNQEGDIITVCGELTPEEYRDNQGRKVHSTRIQANNIYQIDKGFYLNEAELTGVVYKKVDFKTKNDIPGVAVWICVTKTVKGKKYNYFHNVVMFGEESIDFTEKVHDRSIITVRGRLAYQKDSYGQYRSKVIADPCTWHLLGQKPKTNQDKVA